MTFIGIGMPIVRQGVSAPAFVGPFDSYKTGLEVAIGVRRMIGTYTGSLIQVQRASDNATQDIGYTGTGDLDTTALMAFAGSSTLYIKTFYDQSGNANHVTNGNTITCARIVEAGVMNSQNSKPAVKFYRDGNSFTFTNSKTLSAWTIVASMEHDGAGADRPIYANGSEFIYFTSGGLLAMNQFLSGDKITMGCLVAYHVVGGGFNGTQGKLQYDTGIATPTTASFTDTVGAMGSMFHYPSGGPYRYSGLFQEALIWSTYQADATNQAVANIIKSYCGTA